MAPIVQDLFTFMSGTEEPKPPPVTFRGQHDVDFKLSVMSGRSLPGGVSLRPDQLVVTHQYFTKLKEDVYKGCFVDVHQVHALNINDLGCCTKRQEGYELEFKDISAQNNFFVELLKKCRAASWLRSEYIHGFAVMPYPHEKPFGMISSKGKTSKGNSGKEDNEALLHWSSAIFSREIQRKALPAQPKLHVFVRPIYSVTVLLQDVLSQIAQIKRENYWFQKEPQLGFARLGLHVRDETMQTPGTDLPSLFKSARHMVQMTPASRQNDEPHQMTDINNPKMLEDLRKLQSHWSSHAQRIGCHGYYFPKKGMPVPLYATAVSSEGHIQPVSRDQDPLHHLNTHLPHLKHPMPQVVEVAHLPESGPHHTYTWTYDPPARAVKTHLLEWVTERDGGPRHISRIEHTKPEARKFEDLSTEEKEKYDSDTKYRPYRVHLTERRALGADDPANQFHIVSSLFFEHHQRKGFGGWIIDSSVELSTNKVWKHDERLIVTDATHRGSQNLQQITDVCHPYYDHYSPWKVLEHGSRHFWLPKLAISYETNDDKLVYFGVYPRYVCLSNNQIHALDVEHEQRKLSVLAPTAESSMANVKVLGFTPHSFLNDEAVLKAVGIQQQEPIIWQNEAAKMKDLKEWFADPTYRNVLVYKYTDDQHKPLEAGGIGHHFHAPMDQHHVQRAEGQGVAVHFATAKVMATAAHSDPKSFCHTNVGIITRAKSIATGVKQKVVPKKNQPPQQS